MSKVTYYTATTVDGFIADADNSLQWLFDVGDPEDDGGEWDDFIARIGALAGRELRALRAGAASAAPVLSIERMHREFGWRPTPLADRLPAMVEEALAC